MRRLTGWDAYLLYAETPTVHTHTLKILIVDPNVRGEPMKFERFRDVLASFVPRIEPLRFQLLQVPFGLHHPMWLEDAPIDLDDHLFHLTAPPPGRRRELDSLVGEIASTQLDRSRPLWTIHYVDGLAGGRLALVAKIHHALADGVASANAITSVISRSIELPPARAGPPPPRPRTGEILLAAARDHVHSIRRLPSLVRRTVQSVRRVRAAEDLYAPGDLRMLEAPETFLNRPLSPRRAFGTATLSLAAAKRVGDTTNATINDVVLALATGALRQLFLDRGEEPIALIASVPVSINRDPNRMYGNHLAGFFLTLPTDEPDPVERLRRVQQSAALGKKRFDLIGPSLYDDWVEYLPPWPSAAIFRFLASGRVSERNPIFNVPVSNVPGPREQGYIAGMPVVEIYSVGPVMDRSAVNITIWSYNGRLGVGVISDAELVPDAEHLAALVRHSLDELRGALDLPAEVPLVGWDGSQSSAVVQP